jgi:PAS domain S-box-containing protein
MALSVWILFSLTMGAVSGEGFTQILAPRGSALEHSIMLLSWVFLVGLAGLAWLGMSERRRGRRALPYDALERMLHASPIGIILTNNANEIQDINPVAADMFGAGTGIFGRKLEQLFDAQEHTESPAEMLRKDADPLQLTGRTADGERFPVRVTRTRLGDRDDDLNVTFVHQLSQELTLAKSQRHAERQYQALFKGIPDGVFRSLPDGTLISANPALIEMLGGDPSSDPTGKLDTTAFYVDPKDRGELTAELVRSGVVRNAILQLKRCDGEMLRVLANISAVRDSDNRPILFEGTLTDLTGFELAPASGSN